MIACNQEIIAYTCEIAIYSDAMAVYTDAMAVYSREMRIYSCEMGIYSREMKINIQEMKYYSCEMECQGRSTNGRDRAMPCPYHLLNNDYILIIILSHLLQIILSISNTYNKQIKTNIQKMKYYSYKIEYQGRSTNGRDRAMPCPYHLLNNDYILIIISIKITFYLDNSTKPFIFVANAIFYLSPFKITKTMQNRLEDKLSMYEKVDAFLQTNMTVLNAALPILTTVYTDFKTKLDDILATIQAASVDTTGYTEDKAQRRQDLEQLALKITRALTAYAGISKNLSLRAKINYNKSDLSKMRDNDLFAHTKVIEDYATQYGASITVYGISTNEIIDLGKKVNEFFEVIQTPKTKIEIRSSYLQQLETQMQEQDMYLKDIIDSLLGVLEYDEPLLFSQYKKARSIDQTGIQSSSKTFSGSINSNSSAAVTMLTYDADRTFVFKNTGTTTLFFGLSNDGTTVEGVEIEVGAGDQLTRDSSDMNDSGDTLLVRNADNMAGAYTVNADM